MHLVPGKKRRPASAAPNSLPTKPLLDAILSSLEDDKAIDITVIDLAGKSTIADYMVIASGRSQRHIGALADHLLENLKAKGFGREQPEGLPAADWVVIDALDAVVHLFRPEVRAFYNLEKMWGADLA